MTWLEGTVEVPLWIVSAIVGLLVLGTLVYFARRA